MNRRDAVLTLVALGAASRPPAAGAQASKRVWRIGYLGPAAKTAPDLVNAFQDGLRDLGYVEGRNIAVEYRWTDARGEPADEAMLLVGARELVASKVDVLVVSIDPAAFAARKAAGNIPIVMMNVTDPVALGLVASLAHPGGNITGLTRLAPELVGKNLQLLREAVPGARRIALLVNATHAMAPTTISMARDAAQMQGFALQLVEVHSSAELEAAFAAFKLGRAEALFVAFDGMFFTRRVQIAELALAQRLPAMFTNTEHVEAGGLISYSPSSIENYRRAAVFVDKILRGMKPGDIPVEQPTKFDLAVNLKTAKALGIVIPQALLLRTDRVIE